MRASDNEHYQERLDKVDKVHQQADKEKHCQGQEQQQGAQINKAKDDCSLRTRE